ncbi:MAG TPA: hypothetical protein VNG51_11160 [Ktedonobacteraceae bacterium]|nr:hypothetical protein [Ktedonobacteraceae bacterium]
MIDENHKDQQITLQREMGFSFEEKSLKQLGYQVIDEVTEYLSTMRERPVWKPLPAGIRETIREQELPEQGCPFENTLAFFRETILPYPQGNGHPSFAAWINSAPAHAEVLIKPLAAAMTGATDIRTMVDEVIAAGEYLLSLPRN